MARCIDGVLLLDKPEGLSSNAALQQVKKMFWAKKAGHTGSLDVLATGMLPICFGKATKFSRFLLDADKVYEFDMQLGVVTATGDREGEVISRKPVPALEEDTLQAVIKQFTGKISQVPSMYSALKHKGKPLYKLARQGVTVEREAREVTIYELVLLAVKGDTLRLRVRCSKGTYVRTLAEDIGEALGCGAHVSFLRRLSAGHYQDAPMVTLPQLEAWCAEKAFETMNDRLFDIDSMVPTWPALELPATAAHHLLSGQAVRVPNSPKEGWVRLYDSNNTFLGAGEMLDDGRVAPKTIVQ